MDGDLAGLSGLAQAQLAGLSHIDLVLFDCDGVLIDSEPLGSANLAECLRAAGVRITAYEALVKYTGASSAETRRLIAEEYGPMDFAAVFAGSDERLFRRFAEELEPIPGIGAVVAAIRRPVCVASNSRVVRLQSSLGLLPLAREFGPHIYSAEMVAEPKPAPDLLLHAAQAVDARPALSVMIDDSPHGVAAGVAAGMPAIGFIAGGDPRPGREEVLRAAGAFAVAKGAAELPAALAAADALIGERLAQGLVPGGSRPADRTRS